LRVYVSDSGKEDFHVNPTPVDRDFEHCCDEIEWLNPHAHPMNVNPRAELWVGWDGRVQYDLELIGNAEETDIHELWERRHGERQAKAKEAEEEKEATAEAGD